MSCQNADSEVQHSVLQKLPHSKAQPAVITISNNFSEQADNVMIILGNLCNHLKHKTPISKHFETDITLKIIIGYIYKIILDKTHKTSGTIQ